MTHASTTRQGAEVGRDPVLRTSRPKGRAHGGARVRRAIPPCDAEHGAARPEAGRAGGSVGRPGVAQAARTAARRTATGPAASSFCRWRLITMRWIWFVPSKICMIFASRMNRSSGNSVV